MKNHLLSIALLVVISALAVPAGYAQEYGQISTNPMSLIFGVFKAEVEIAAPKNWAIETELSLLSKGQRFWIPDYDTKGYRFGLIAKKYVNSSAPQEGFYGFGYSRFSDLLFTDFRDEGQQTDQLDFERRRVTIGFGAGYTAVGLDGFTYGFSLGIGRHVVNEKEYTSSNGVSKPLDEEIFTIPIDVYGRVYIGIRLYTQAGLERKKAYEAELDAWQEEQKIINMQDRIQPSREYNAYPNEDQLEYE